LARVGQSDSKAVQKLLSTYPLFPGENTRLGTGDSLQPGI